MPLPFSLTPRIFSKTTREFALSPVIPSVPEIKQAFTATPPNEKVDNLSTDPLDPEVGGDDKNNQYVKESGSLANSAPSTARNAFASGGNVALPAPNATAFIPLNLARSKLEALHKEMKVLKDQSIANCEKITKEYEIVIQNNRMNTEKQMKLANEKIELLLNEKREVEQQLKRLLDDPSLQATEIFRKAETQPEVDAGNKSNVPIIKSDVSIPVVSSEREPPEIVEEQSLKTTEQQEVVSETKPQQDEDSQSLVEWIQQWKLHWQDIFEALKKYEEKVEGNENEPELSKIEWGKDDASNDKIKEMKSLLKADVRLNAIANTSITTEPLEDFPFGKLQPRVNLVLLFAINWQQYKTNREKLSEFVNRLKLQKQSLEDEKLPLNELKNQIKAMKSKRKEVQEAAAATEALAGALPNADTSLIGDELKQLIESISSAEKRFTQKRNELQAASDTLRADFAKYEEMNRHFHQNESLLSKFLLGLVYFDKESEKLKDPEQKPTGEDKTVKLSKLFSIKEEKRLEGITTLYSEMVDICQKIIRFKRPKQTEESPASTTLQVDSASLPTAKHATIAIVAEEPLKTELQIPIPVSKNSSHTEIPPKESQATPTSLPNVEIDIKILQENFELEKKRIQNEYEIQLKSKSEEIIALQKSIQELKMLTEQTESTRSKPISSKTSEATPEVTAKEIEKPRDITESIKEANLESTQIAAQNESLHVAEASWEKEKSELLRQCSVLEAEIKASKLSFENDLSSKDSQIAKFREQLQAESTEKLKSMEGKLAEIQSLQAQLDEVTKKMNEETTKKRAWRQKYRQEEEKTKEIMTKLDDLKKQTQEIIEKEKMYQQKIANYEHDLTEEKQKNEELTTEKAIIYVQMTEERKKRQEFQWKYEELRGKIRVYARIRPFNKDEASKNERVFVRQGKNEWTLECREKVQDYTGKVTENWRDFQFDQIFCANAETDSIVSSGVSTTDVVQDNDKAEKEEDLPPSQKVPENIYEHLNAQASTNNTKPNQMVTVTTTNRQIDVFNSCVFLCETVRRGLNACVFAYGQSGTGKTFTMSGILPNPANNFNTELVGLKPRIISHLYEMKNNLKDTVDMNIEFCCVEIYLNRLEDIIWKYDSKMEKRKRAKAGKNEPDAVPPELKVRMDAKKRILIENVKMKSFPTATSTINFLENAETLRRTRRTGLNENSSRSHLILVLYVTCVEKKTGKKTAGKLSLVDLAGSERVDKTNIDGLSKAQRESMLEEGVAINESLRMLKNIFRVLGGAQAEGEKEAKGKTKEIAQYRGNMLTELLQDSIGGNAKTIMFVNLGPAESNSHETLDSLSYGDLVKNIVNEKGGADEDFSEVIRKLKDKLAKYEEKFGNL